MQAHAYAGGDNSHFDRLLREGHYADAITLAAEEHGPKLGRFCMAMLGSQAESEEACQETLLAAFSALASYRGEGTLRAWLYGIARRVCARRLESRTRQDKHLRLVHDASAEVGLPDELVEATRRARRVRVALEALKPSERDTVVLRYEAGLSYREIAELMSIDEATARKRASRALEELKHVLKEA